MRLSELAVHESPFLSHAYLMGEFTYPGHPDLCDCHWPKLRTEVQLSWGEGLAVYTNGGRPGQRALQASMAHGFCLSFDRKALVGALSDLALRKVSSPVNFVG